MLIRLQHQKVFNKTQNRNNKLISDSIIKRDY